MAVRRWTTGLVATCLLATLCAVGASLAAPPPPAAAADPALSIERLDVGFSHACAVASDGQAECWGTSGDSVLGTGATLGMHSRSQAVLTSGTPLAGKTVAEVASGHHGSCALTTDDVIACWGFASLLPAPYTSAYSEPVAVPTAGTPLAGKDIVEVTVGTNHACALTADGVAACWGNDSRQLGIDDTPTYVDVDVPTAVQKTGTPFAGKAIAQISAGSSSTCAVSTDGVLACWGLGGDDGIAKAIPLAGTPLAGKAIAAVSAGNAHRCALATDGTVGCWGENSAGQIGDGTKTGRTAITALATAGTPLAGKTVARLAAGTWHTCAVTTDGVAACWGRNSSGQLGDGTTTERLKPVAVTTTGTPLAGATLESVSLGVDFTCAVATNGIAACWGNGAAGRLGDGRTTSSSLPRGVLPRVEVPSAPTGVTVGVGNGRITVRWTPPSSAGATPITTYRVALYAGNARPAIATVTAPIPSGSSTSMLAFVTNGVQYRVRVAAMNSTGSQLGTWSAFSAPFTPRAPYTPFASSTALVNRLFSDIVGRTPTTTERAQWVRDIDDGARTKGQLADSLRRSSENATFVDPTARLYRAVLGRAPDAGGLDFWIGRRRSGTWSLTRMANFFAASAEFRAKYGDLSNTEFVQQIYTDVLGRPATGSDLAYWTAELSSGRRSRGQLVIGFSESPEYKAKQREATDVSVAYILLLDRAPTTAETSAWVTAQKGGTSHTALLQALLDSPAYQDHIT